MELKEKWICKEFTNRENEIYHNAYEVELYFYQAIRNGELAYIERVCSQEHFEEMTGLGTLSTNAFKSIQYHFVVSVALAARACVEEKSILFGSCQQGM